MSIVIIDGIEYCVETPPSEDDGDNSNNPSSDTCEEINRYK